jgi:hypothetical protein
MGEAALLSSLRENNSWSVKLGSAKFVEVVMIYVIFCGADFFRIIFKEQTHNK